ncbi:PadR family transcriptional regulator [Streptomyces violaceusniger]|uniref:Helix-turn-helix transcriptional regulator n=2 Tax=Streptomyces violaceusniger group TaxID=2839105 RepID=A0ABD5JDX0_9ACTN|nr:PadR family transcriptional regulator [Streptomyces violaceusniger]KUL46656.1 PadR family transcriptional regulator [Streptomyces violaceusniger]MEE4586590.1 helix-turn-helix transcriptional regulator [Streptomyces sp. DSM 41602]
MPPVFAHGRLRLYLLKLLDEAPRHGYEVIRLLEERFQGLYAPSAGTVYPRLAKLEAEGLVTHTTEGGRKVYSITDAGRAELADRSGELADLELEIRESVAELAAEIREDVRGSASDLRREMREAAQQARASGGTGGSGGAGGSQEKHGPWEGPWGDKETWRQAKEDLRRAKEEWKEQARRAKEESRRARQDAQRARKQAKDAQDFAREEVQRIARRVQEQTQEHIRAGDWQQAVREGLAEVSRGMSRISWQGTSRSDWGWDDETSGPDTKVERMDMTKPKGGGEKEKPTGGGSDSGAAGVREPEWAKDFTPSNAPARDLERLLDRLRDDIRDAARDHGVTDAQLADARHHLGATAARITALLRGDQA